MSVETRIRKLENLGSGGEFDMAAAIIAARKSKTPRMTLKELEAIANPDKLLRRIIEGRRRVFGAEG